ncbi:MAG: peptidylprolyl isomerase [Salibacteraceae bacterium]|jgi:peptidylprolyl isomerase
MKKLVIGILFLGFGFGLKAQTIVTFYTNMGSFEVELYDSIMPITTDNIKTLVNDKYYDGVIFHRIMNNFVIQGGDPTGTGSGGPGYSIQDEFDSTLSNVVKTLSMANSGPNTGGSQFFINMKNNIFLDYDKAPLTSAHPVFGIVISGWDTVEMIEAVPVNGSDRPLTDVVMDSVRVTQFPLAVFALNNHGFALEVYPNPVTENSYLSVKVPKNTTAQIQVTSMNGAVLYSQTKVMSQGINTWELSEFNFQQFTRGMYLVTVRSAEFIQYVKVKK